MNSNGLKLSKYSPKVSDPRVFKRIATVLQWCKPLLLQRRPQQIHSTELTRVFGNQKTPLAGYLRANLLVQSGTYAPGIKNYAYLVKQTGFEKISKLIDFPFNGELPVAVELYGRIASGEEIPEYSEPTDGARRYHPVQNLPKSLRAEVFKGWFDFDIQAAAPTLVYQHACKIRQRLEPTSTKEFIPAIARLVNDRAEVRKYVGELTGLDEKTVKQMLIALFFGSKLVPHKQRAIFRILNCDYEMLERLKKEAYISEFCRNVELMWMYVINNDNKEKGMAAFRGESKPIQKPSTKAKHRMAIYLKLERTVIDVVESALMSKGVVPMLIHDGFMTKVQVDKSALEEAINNKTGYVVRLSESIVGNSTAEDAAKMSDEMVNLINEDCE